MSDDRPTPADLARWAFDDDRDGKAFARAADDLDDCD